MKLQYLAVIFVIIILPIALVLGFYMQTQIDIVNKQTSYTSKLNDATYDAVKAFQLNTTNSHYSSVSDSKIRDVEASVNTFYNSLMASLNYTKPELQEYVPAIVYTLYDGYYIYGKRYNVYKNGVERKGGSDPETKDELTKVYIAADTETATNPDLYEYGLKPYVYYSCRYKKDSKNDFVVNFTLDNFISVYGTVNGNYVTKSGYLIKLSDWNTSAKTYKGAYVELEEVLEEYLQFKTDAGYTSNNYKYVIYQNQKIYINGSRYFWFVDGYAREVNSQDIKDSIGSGATKSAREYYTEAYNFSKWVNDNIGQITQSNIVNETDQTKKAELEYDAGTSRIFEMTTQDPLNPASTFNQHRIAVIKHTIETNLIAAINSYNSNSGSYAYAMPKLTEEEWDKVVNNVCVIAFMQGMPMGGRYFNNYVVVSNDKNNEYVDIDSIYLLGSDHQYHAANCPDLVSGSVSITGGYINTSFERQTLNDNYYYLHAYTVDTYGGPSRPSYYTACYHCIVNNNSQYDLYDIFMASNNRIPNTSINISTLRSKYLTILAREKYNLYKTNN